MDKLSPALQADVAAIGSISVVPTILDVICRTTGMGFAAVARVTDTQWIVCSVHDDIQFGLQPGGELKLETTICHEIRQSGEGVVIDNVSDDPAFCNHHTPAMYGFKSYISMPIMRKDGTFFGTLCAIDPRPAQLNNPQIIGMFKLYADLISFHLNAIDQLAASETDLIEERRIAELREQFIAILGHDMRNPLSAIMNSAQLLQRMPLEEKPKRIANIILDSGNRMKGLIENVLDFARGKMGGGITLDTLNSTPVAKIILQVTNEMLTIAPDRVIKTMLDLGEPVVCDGKRMAQLFSNLLSNALTHGQPDTPVIVTAASGGGQFILAVANQGKKIPAIALERLFQPFSRGGGKQNSKGLGLGLYIALQIALAHKGSLVVSSTDEETVFTLRMPSNQS